MLRKKIFSLVLLVTMVLAAAIPALASEGYTLDNSLMASANNLLNLTNTTGTATTPTAASGTVATYTTGPRYRIPLIQFTGDNVQTYAQAADKITLKLYVSNAYSTADVVNVYGITGSDKSTNLSTVTYNNASATLKEIPSTADDAIATVSFETSTGKYIEIDVTEYVKEEAADKNVIFKFTAPGVNRGSSWPTIYFIASTNQEPYLCFYSEDNDPDQEAANAAIASLSVPSSVSEGFQLTLTHSGGASISWESSDSEIIAVDNLTGAASVTRPAVNTEVTLTATASLNGKTAVKAFTVKVIKEFAENTTELIANADTYVQSTNPDNNYNNEHQLRLNGSGRQNFVRFDDTDVPAAYTKVTLNFQIKVYPAGYTGTFSLLSLTGEDITSWDEDVTHNSAGSLISAGSAITLPEKPLAGDYQAGDWVSFDVTDYIKSQEGGACAFRFHGAAGDLFFYSREVAGKEPTLIFHLVDAYQAAANEALEALDVPSVVSEGFQLALTHSGGASISWESSDSEIVAVDNLTGAASVTRPAVNTEVTLTATASFNGKTAVKAFTVRVIKQFAADTIEVIADADTYVRSNYSGTNYNDRFELPLNGSGCQNLVRFDDTDISRDYQYAVLSFKLKSYPAEYGGAFSLLSLTGEDITSWGEDATYTSAGSVVSAGSAVTLPTSPLAGDYQAEDWVSFDVTDYIKSQEGGACAFRLHGGSGGPVFYSREIADKEPVLTFYYGDTGAAYDDASKITLASLVAKDFTLPLSGANGSAISWQSDSSAITIVNENAQIIRNAGADTSVTLTATFTKGSAVVTKAFTVVVAKALPENALFFSKDGFELTAAVTGTVNVGVNITDSALQSAIEASCRLIVCEYAGNRVISMEMFDYSSLDGSETFTISNASNKVKAMLINFDTLVPVVAAKEI